MIGFLFQIPWTKLKGTAIMIVSNLWICF